MEPSTFFDDHRKTEFLSHYFRDIVISPLCRVSRSWVGCGVAWDGGAGCGGRGEVGLADPVGWAGRGGTGRCGVHIHILVYTVSPDKRLEMRNWR